MSVLTDPIAIGAAEAPSRVVFGAHETNLGWGRSISNRHVAYYGRRAEGGAGVIVTETASVLADDWPYERAPLARECEAGWEAIAETCAPFGTVVLAGLGHAGAQGSSAFSQSVLWAPSRVADVVSREPPAELDQDGIDSIVSGFARAAAMAVGAGLHGVEVDSGAFSLLRQFQSGLTNLRQDAYGADRLLFTREVLGAARTAMGPRGVLAVRLSCDEMAPWAGITAEAGAAAVASLACMVDMITVVRAGPYATAANRPDGHVDPGFNLDLCRAAHEAAEGRTAIALQGSVVDAGMAEEAVSSATADLVEMTRAQIAEPRFVSLLREDEPARIRPCILCNQTCRVRDNRNPIVTCVGEPRSGYETVDPPDEPGTEGGNGPPVLVIGGGPAGLECARVLAAGGRSVRIAERSRRLGGAFTAAAVGPGRARFTLLVEWLVAECARLGVEVALGEEVDAATVEAAQAEGWELVLATGSVPFTGRYAASAAITVTDPLAVLTSGLETLPQGPVVVHDTVGDSVAVSLAEWLAAAGRAVAYVTPDPVAGTQLARTGDLADANGRLMRAGVVRWLRNRILSLDDGSVTVSDVWTGETRCLPAAVVVDCGHRLPEETLYQAVGSPSSLRAGDCVAPRTVHEAILEGRRAALALLGSAVMAGAHG